MKAAHALDLAHSFGDEASNFPSHRARSGGDGDADGLDFGASHVDGEVVAVVAVGEGIEARAEARRQQCQRHRLAQLVGHEEGSAGDAGGAGQEDAGDAVVHARPVPLR